MANERKARDRELAITYGGRTFDLLAYALIDFGVWEAVAGERGTSGPALPAAEWGVPGLYRDPWTALSILVHAIIQKVDTEPADGRFRDPDVKGPTDGP